MCFLKKKCEKTNKHTIILTHTQKGYFSNPLEEGFFVGKGYYDLRPCRKNSPFILPPIVKWGSTVEILAYRYRLP